MKQATALQILKTGRNVFLTGSAGAGKTYTINQYLHYLRAREVAVAVTASTGIAATHMNGMTIHSWAGIGILDELTAKDLARIAKRPQLQERIERTQVLVIDEISMLHRKQLDMVNQVLQTIKDNALPFGGIQLLVAGDFFQLPPIGEAHETTRDKFAFMAQAWLDADFTICYLTEQHRQRPSPSDEHTPAGQNQNVYHGLDLTAILNQIRSQTFTDDIMPALYATANHTLAATRTRLFTHNVNVNTINDQQLASLATPAQTYHGWGEGDEKMVETLKKGVRNNPDLELKIGAKVMFIKNNAELGVANGTLGTVVDFASLIDDKDKDKEKNHDNAQAVSPDNSDNLHTDKLHTKESHNCEIQDREINTDDATDATAPPKNLFPVVKLNDGRQITVGYDVWQINDEEDELIAAYYHIPLTLAWAITIHKSQGMTLDAAEIDLSKTFERGQGYVALSRLKQLSGLRLLGLNELSLQLDPLARGADRRFLALSAEQEAEFLRLDPEKIEDEQQGFILKSRGTLDKHKIAAYEKRLAQRQKAMALRRHAVEQALTTPSDELPQASCDDTDAHRKQQKKPNTSLPHGISPTLLETKQLLDESLTIAEVAEKRQLAQSTIMGHIEKLQTAGVAMQLEHIRPDEPCLVDVAAAVQAVYGKPKGDSQTPIELRPLYEHLKGRYPFNVIRLALLFVE